nr:sigma-70 family RNA polymerase sigma factor [Flavivirga sp. MEBiC07777]
MPQNQKSVCEEKNFKIIFEDYSEVIRNFVYYKCGDISKAEDITQDAFVKLWLNCKQVLFSKAKSYVMKVAQNTFYNLIKHEKVKLNYKVHLKSNYVNKESPDFIMEEKEFMVLLTKSINELPVKEREVFLLSRKDKKTYKEIAEIVGITQKAVERRMHLALLKLRSKIGEKI